MSGQIFINKDKLISLADKFRNKLQYKEEGGQEAAEQDYTIEELIKIADEEFIIPTGDAVETNVLAGYTFFGGDAERRTGSIPSVKETVITPKNEDLIIKAGQYIDQNITIKTDPNLIPENIREGYTIFGVKGSYKGGVFNDDITDVSWKDLSFFLRSGFDFSNCLGQSKTISVSGSEVDAILVSTTYNKQPHLVFMTFDPLPTQYAVQTDGNTKTSGGWENATLRSALEGEIYNSLSSELKNVMTSVPIIYTTGSGNFGDLNAETDTLNTKIFIPSVREIKGANGSWTKLNSSAKNEGEQFEYFANPTGLIPTDSFVTRTRATINQFVRIPANNGTQVEIWFNTPHTVLFCFVL